MRNLPFTVQPETLSRFLSHSFQASVPPVGCSAASVLSRASWSRLCWKLVGGTGYSMRPHLPTTPPTPWWRFCSFQSSWFYSSLLPSPNSPFLSFSKGYFHFVNGIIGGNGLLRKMLLKITVSELRESTSLFLSLPVTWKPMRPYRLSWRQVWFCMWRPRATNDKWYFTETWRSRFKSHTFKSLVKTCDR